MFKNKEWLVPMNGNKSGRITGVLILIILALCFGLFWQYRSHLSSLADYQNEVEELRIKQINQLADLDMYLALIENFESNVQSDDEFITSQEEIIRSFILGYYTFLSGEEMLRIDNVAEYITEDMLAMMRDATSEDEPPRGWYHLALTASNINLYRGATDEFLATFNVYYESDITRNMTQILVVKFVMDELLIENFRIISASEVFHFD